MSYDTFRYCYILRRRTAAVRFHTIPYLGTHAPLHIPFLVFLVQSGRMNMDPLVNTTSLLDKTISRDVREKKNFSHSTLTFLLPQISPNKYLHQHSKLTFLIDIPSYTDSYASNKLITYLPSYVRRHGA